MKKLALINCTENMRQRPLHFKFVNAEWDFLKIFNSGWPQAALNLVEEVSAAIECFDIFLVNGDRVWNISDSEIGESSVSQMPVNTRTKGHDYLKFVSFGLREF